MRRASTICPPRRGIASLELVLVFPMLVAIVAALFLIGKADVVKLSAVTKARQVTWKGRPSAPSGPDRLRPWHAPSDSEFPPGSQAVQSVPMSVGPPFAGQIRQGQSGNTIVANPWDSQSTNGIHFLPRQKNMVPHTGVLGLIGSEDITNGAFVGFQVLFDPGMDTGGNPALKGARLFGTGGPLVPGSNFWVQLAGDALEYPVGATINMFFDGVNKAWDILNDVSFHLAGLTSQGKEITKALNTIETYLNFFHNLYEASRGRPGEDPYSDVSDI